MQTIFAIQMCLHSEDKRTLANWKCKYIM